MMPDNTIEAGIAFLAEAGLNLFAILDCATLPSGIQTLLRASHVPLDAYQRLVLIGHGGQRMWAALQAWGMQTTGPVDHFSTVMARKFIADYLHHPPTLWLYPDTPYIVPLQQLGELAGWSYPSPLGSGISPIYGVWFAYRAAFLTNADIPVMRHAPVPSPCDKCAEKPCMTTCPVQAVQLNAFAVDACAHHRLRPKSPCMDRCLARMACPFFPEHRYTLPQIQYHYTHSLGTIKAWYAQ